VAELNVELVAAERLLWSGHASFVTARTTEGELGVLPGHTPLLGVLAPGAVRIRTVEGQTVLAAVHGGFLSVADNDVAILSDVAELAEEIDVSRAESSRERLRGTADEDEEARAALARAETRIHVAQMR
jgi:F-type H+-transporting ATPase subunit epsilon